MFAETLHYMGVLRLLSKKPNASEYYLKRSFTMLEEMHPTGAMRELKKRVILALEKLDTNC